MFMKVMVLLGVIPCYAAYFVTCLTMWHNILEDSNLYIQHCGSIRSHIIFIFSTVKTLKLIQISVMCSVMVEALGWTVPSPGNPAMPVLVWIGFVRRL
jgi:hypothetical protein